MPNTSCRLLVVDDDPSVLRTLVKSLRSRGFAPDEAGDGLIALEMIRINPRPYDILITDIAMIGMNGLDLIAHARDISPETRFLLISAFLPGPRRGMEKVPFLQKPFTMDVFVGKVLELCETWPEGMPSALSLSR